MRGETAIAIFAGLRVARAMAIVSLIAGGLAGILSFMTQDGAEAVGLRAAGLFPVLVLLMPGTLALLAWAAVEGRETLLVTILRETRPALTMLVTAAVVGALGGCLAFLLAATLMPGSIGGEDLNQVRIALFGGVGWVRPLVVLLASVVVAVALSWWSVNRLKFTR